MKKVIIVLAAYAAIVAGCLVVAGKRSDERAAKAKAAAEAAVKAAYESGYKAGLDYGSKSAYYVGRADGYAMAPRYWPEGDEDLIEDDLVHDDE